MTNLQKRIAELIDADEQIGLLFNELVHVWENKELYSFLHNSNDLTQIEINLCKQYIPTSSTYYDTPEVLLETLRNVYKVIQ